MTYKPCLHFVGFRGDEYTRAAQIFGPPDFVHYTYDARAVGDMVGARYLHHAVQPLCGSAAGCRLQAKVVTQ